MVTSIQFAHYSHGGRRGNEDTFHYDPELSLWLVADGFGASGLGREAGRIAASVLVARLRRGQRLDRAVQAAHRSIRLARERRPESHGMRATLVALRLDGLRYDIAWLGNTRAYCHDGALRQLTRDHSVVQRLVDAGAITPEEARLHPQRKVITRSLGGDQPVAVETISGWLAPGSRILLCSDGLTAALSEEAIAAGLTQRSAPSEAVDGLVAAARSGHGGEDITLAVIDVPRHRLHEASHELAGHMEAAGAKPGAQRQSEPPAEASTAASTEASEDGD